MPKLIGSLLHLLPKNHLSSLTGWLVSRPLPSPVGAWSVKWFAKRYAIRLDEAEQSIENYPTIAALFTRALKKGIRPIAEASVVHPADAVLSQFGKLAQNSELIQAKGKTYSVVDLLKNSQMASHFESGYYATYYLCPTDYHRVHSPVDGEIVSANHIPGTLWPVNDWSVNRIPRLFTVNERCITYIKTPLGFVAVVMVGATNVGKMVMAYDATLVTNRSGTERDGERNYQPTLPIRRGDTLGIFNMGSTVVVLFADGVVKSEVKARLGSATRMGERFSQ